MGTIMEYDPNLIRKEKRIINGKEYMVTVAPPGMHGKGFQPGMFDHISDTLTDEEKDKIRQIIGEDPAIPDMEDDVVKENL
jgi:hypothetical protein